MARVKQSRGKRVKSGRVVKVACKRTFYQYEIGIRDICFREYQNYKGDVSNCDLPLESLHTIGMDAKGMLHYKCKLYKFETLPVWYAYNGELRLTSLFEAFRKVSLDLFGEKAADFWYQAQSRRQDAKRQLQV